MTKPAATLPRLERSPLARWVPSPNFGARKPPYAAPTLIVLHHTAIASMQASLNALTNPATQVSAHYLIGADGELLQLVDDGDRAWHAGVSRWHDITDVNSASIGIELVNDGFTPFPAAQIHAVLALLADLIQRHCTLHNGDVLGHADVAPGRKVDPNRFFPWVELSRAGFGRWYPTPLPAVPTDFDPVLALRMLGYDTSNVIWAIRAFHLHFRGVHGDTLDATDAAILVALLGTQVLHR